MSTLKLDYRKDNVGNVFSKKMRYQKFKDLKNENIVFSYTGSLAFPDIILWKELTDNALKLQMATDKQRRRLINILIEGLQNIQIHGETDGSGPLNGAKPYLLILCREDNGLVLVFGNLVKAAALNALEAKLRKLDELSKPELKQLYMEVVERGEITEKGGAGLGLVKMYLDSDKNTAYNFEPIDKEYSFFSLEVRVSEK